MYIINSHLFKCSYDRKYLSQGNVKAIWTGNDPNHYMKAMNRKNGPHLLHEYAPISIEAIADYLEGESSIITTLENMGLKIPLTFDQSFREE